MEEKLDRPAVFIKSNFIRVLIIIDVIVFIFLLIFAISPELTEIIYSKGIYPVISFLLGSVSDLVDYSITELLIIIISAILLVRIFYGLYQLIRRRRTFKNLLLHFLKQSFVLVSIILFCFYLFWGYNYYRKPLEAKSEKINTEKDITEKLFEETLFLFINKANDLYYTNIARNGYSFEKLNDVINKAVADAVYDLDKIKINPAKKMKISLTNILEYSSNLGVISPFMLESHISKELIDAELPFIMAHEKSHLYGYANETEANFIGFYACVKSGDSYLEYSAYSQMLRYLLSQYRANVTEEEYEEIYSLIREEIRDEYVEQRQRYKKYDTVFSQIVRSVYDLYLRANNTKGGVAAYSRVTQLVIKSKWLYDVLFNSDYDDDIIIEENFKIDSNLEDLDY